MKREKEGAWFLSYVHDTTVETPNNARKQLANMQTVAHPQILFVHLLLLLGCGRRRCLRPPEDPAAPRRVGHIVRGVLELVLSVHVRTVSNQRVQDSLRCRAGIWFLSDSTRQGACLEKQLEAARWGYVKLEGNSGRCRKKVGILTLGLTAG